MFGLPPVLEGEDAEARKRLLDCAYRDIGPTDIINEFWIYDLVDNIWMHSRYRRIQTALLNDLVSEQADDKAHSRVFDEIKSMAEGPEKEALNKLLDKDFELDPEIRVERNPDAYKKYLKLYQSARSELDLDGIQACVLIDQFDTVERIEHLREMTGRRFDTVVREMDRHRLIGINVEVAPEE